METQRHSGSVSPPFWTEVWILGGGPSRKQFDLNLLTGKTVLALNDAAVALPTSVVARSAVTVFSADNCWVRRHRDFLIGFPGEKYLAIDLDSWPDCVGIPDVTYLRCLDRSDLSEDPTAVHGLNTGAAAINLAYLKRARTVHLVGYDMQPEGPDADIYTSWAPLFRNQRRQLQHAAVEVINHNPDSAIDAFPKIRLEVTV